MSTRVNAIRKLQIGRYEVELRSEDGEERLLFVFDGEDIQVVKSPDDFAEYMQLKPGAASALFEAILAFHRAQKLTMPP